MPPVRPRVEQAAPPRKSLLKPVEDEFSDTSSLVSGFADDADINVRARRRQKSARQSALHTHKRPSFLLTPQLQVGDRVRVQGKGDGLVRFKGTTKFKPGPWCVPPSRIGKGRFVVV